MNDTENQLKPWQSRLHEIIYEADTPSGKLFDVLLILFILLSILNIMLESVESIDDVYGHILVGFEWFFTIAFTVEYILRLICIKKPMSYVLSFFGVIDLLAIMPSYLELVIESENVHYLAVVRLLRVLRLFRILKLAPYLKEANVLAIALSNSRRKVFIFMSSVLVLVVIFGALMFLIESEVNANFTSIPKSVYWAIVTITTVGYGDISPVTPLGQFLSAIVMMLGYGILAVPTGIVSVELNEAYKRNREITTVVCTSCAKEGHDKDANHCKYCGDSLKE